MTHSTLPIPPMLLALAGILTLEAMLILGTIHDWVTAAPISFAVGLVVGFVLSDRYRITRRNGDGPAP